MTYLNNIAATTPSYSPQLPAPAQLNMPQAPAAQTVSAPDSLSMAQTNAPLQTANTVQFAPTSSSVPTLTTLNISRNDLQWATELEAKVQQGYQPTAQERSYYEALGAQLALLKNNIKPMSPAPALPQIQMPTGSPAPAPTGQAPQQTNGVNPFGPDMPAAGEQVTMSEIEWALIVEEKVQKYGYKPSPEEEARYQNILGRFKNNDKIKMTFLDSLAAQSPWVGANVGQVRYGKIVASEVTNLISAIKTGNGSVVGALKGIGMATLKSTGISALVSGGFSAVTNGIAYWRGEKTKTQAVSNVVTDTVTGGITGLGATLAGGAVMAALAGTAVSGIGLTLLVGGAGMLGGWLTDKLFTSTGGKDWVKSKTIAMMDGLGPKIATPPATAPAQ